ncbi:hypothetical protein U0C82_06795 [Fulvimarina sp. 2208YS6-2-32]|uniref:Uncharacterized protein n=1 Tax=Fulvimarina uroteuthidis TaxID=3098149 RepID=A0ABU5I0W2_9HYPH|nr:hypothetical protein [Fulvimarina sp. 2208YS6-2-32]MDY8108851.1 hypothetical protein [Fulvimarina sp. 2208YS6-2-32]
MTAAIFSFARRRTHEAPLAPKMPWQNQDLAELYRVRDRLAAAGLPVEVEGGVSDEGDPWFVYQQTGTDTVVVHICRIDTEIHIINCITGNAYSGASFREVSDRMLEDAPLALGADIRRASNVVLHPSAFLTAFVAAAIMLVDLVENGRAEAGEIDGGADAASTDAAHADADGADAADAPAGAGSADAEALGLAQGGERPQAGDEAGEDAQLGQRRLQLLKEMTGSLSSVPASGAHGSILSEVPMASLSAGLFAAELMRVFAQDNPNWHMRDYAGTLAAGVETILSALDPRGEKANAPDAEIHVPADPDTSLVSALDIAVRSDMAEAVTIRTGAQAPGETADREAPLHRAHFGDALIQKAGHGAAPDAADMTGPAATAPLAGTGSDTAAPAPQRQVPARAEKQAPAPDAPSSSSSSEARNTQSSSTSAPNSVGAQESQTVAASRGGSDSVSNADKAVSLSTDAGLTAARSAHNIEWLVGQITQSKLLSPDRKGAGQHTADAKAGDGARDKGDADDRPVISLSDKIAATTSGEKDGISGSLVLSGSAGDRAPQGDDKPGLDSHKPSVDVPLAFTAPGELVAGRFDAVRVEAGADLTIAGFVFGEDIVSFENESVASRYAEHVWQQGNDLLMGEAGSGTVRLVGVFADPSLIMHEGAGPLAA